MKTRLVILILLSAFSFNTISAQLMDYDGGADYCVDTTESFQVGEKIEYDLYFNWTAIWLKAGVVKFSIKDGSVDGTPAMHCVAEARTPRSFDWIYRVRDKYESYLDYNTLNPLRFIRDVNEGDYTKQLQYTYTPADSSVNVDYYYRRGELKAQNELLSIMYEVSFKFLGQDTLKHNGKKYRCNKFVPKLIQGGIFEEKDEIIIWVTDDENKLPLLVESDLNFGKIKAYLKKHRGLRHEVTSLIP